MHQLDLTDMHGTFHPTIAKYTFFSCTHGIFSWMAHMLGYRTSLNKLKKTKIIQSMFHVNYLVIAMCQCRFTDVDSGGLCEFRGQGICTFCSILM